MTGNTDALVIKWGEELFYRPVRTQRSKKNVAGLFSMIRPGSHSISTRADRIRQTLKQTIKRAPEVVVKISGSGRGMKHIRAHFDYIARNGKVNLEDQDGDLIIGRNALQDIQEEWRYGQYGIPDDSYKRESFNIVLSMPPGTNRELLKRAARDFARSEFSDNHQYVFASHDDEKHPHIHLCVKALGIDGTRLNPRKGDLQAWREKLANELRLHGVEANATPRHARCVTRKGQKQSKVHADRRSGINLAALGALAATTNLERWPKVGKVVFAYRGLALAFSTAPSAEDRALAVGIVSLLKSMPVIAQMSERTIELNGHVKGATGNQPQHRDVVNQPNGPERE